MADQIELTVDRSRLQLGTEIAAFAEHGRAGVMLTAARSQARSRSSITGYSARGTVVGGAVGAYAQWDNEAVFVDASVQHGRFANRVEGDGLAIERYDATVLQSSLEAGYRIRVGQLGRMALGLQPELQLIHTDASTDLHREANGTQVRSLGNAGLSGRLGLRLQGEAVAGGVRHARPYLAANWYREGSLGGVAFDGEALGSSTPRDRYALDAGAQAEWRNGVSAWGGVGVMRGDGGFRERGARLGLAYRW